MKLSNSVLSFKNILNAKLDNNTKNRLTVFIIGLKQNKKINDYKRAFRWAIWHSLSPIDREYIIDKSIPRETWIGGYPDVNDSHIDTLLKKVITTQFIVQCETGLIINKNKLLSKDA